MRGNGWHVFGVILVLGILVVVAGSALEIAADSAGTGVGIVVRVIVGVLTAPLSALAAVGALLRAACSFARRRQRERPAGHDLSSAGHPAEDPAGDVKGLAVDVVRPG